MGNSKDEIESIKVIKFNNKKEDCAEFALKFKAKLMKEVMLESKMDQRLFLQKNQLLQIMMREERS